LIELDPDMMAVRTQPQRGRQTRRVRSKQHVVGRPTLLPIPRDKPTVRRLMNKFGSVDAQFQIVDLVR